MKQRLHRILALVLCFVMTVSLLPTSAFADAEPEQEAGYEVYTDEGMIAEENMSAEDSEESTADAGEGTPAEGGEELPAEGGEELPAEGDEELPAEEDEKILVEGVMTGEAFLALAQDGVITLTGDVTLTVSDETSLTVAGEMSSYTVNLDKHTLIFDGNAYAVIEEGGSLTLRNGKVVANDIEDPTNGLFNIRSNSTLTLDSIELKTNACALFTNGDAAAVNVRKSEINANSYAVSTNAETADNSNVIINLIDSGFIAQTGIMLNIPGTLSMIDCRVIGNRQGVIVRGGTMTACGSHILLNPLGDPYDYPEEWGPESNVPFGALVVGNQGDGYQYPSDVTVDEYTVIEAMAGLGNSLVVRSNTTAGNGVALDMQNTIYSGYVDYGPVKMVASVDGKLFTDLQTAINACPAGGTVTLLGDVEASEQINISKNITLDLAGKTVTDVRAGIENKQHAYLFTGNSTVLLKNGEIRGKILWSAGRLNLGVGFSMSDTENNKGYRISVCDSATVTVSSEAKVYGEHPAIALFPRRDAEDVHPTLHVYGTVTGEGFAIATNGSSFNKAATEINIYPGAKVTSNQSTAIYAPQQNNVVNITGGEITGADCGVEIRAGVLNVRGKATITATSDEFSCDSNGSGTTTVGAAIAIAQHTTKQDIAVNIEGGTFTGVKALHESNPQENDPAPRVALSVRDGNFVGEITVADTQAFISGGTFSDRVSAVYCAEGYVPAENSDGSYGVTLGGLVEKITDEATVSGNTVTVRNSQLEFCPADPDVGRMDAGYWIGVKLHAPDNYAAGARGARYTRDAANASKGSFDKSFDDNRDGEWFIGLWGQITPEYLAAAKKAGGEIVYTWYVDWDNDRVLDQTVRMVIDAGTITLLHNMEKVSAEAATCTAAGNEEYWHCKDCGRYFRDEAGAEMLEQDDWVIKATGHKLTEIEAKEATCTEAGNNAYWTCETCHKVFKDDKGETETTVEAETIAAKGHSMTKTAANAATCTAAGNNDYYTCGTCHKVYQDAAGETETTVAAETIAAKDHDWGEVSYSWSDDHKTCTAKRVCGNDREHVEDETADSVAATEDASCEKAGKITYTVSFKNAAFATQTATVTIAATGHDMIETEAKAATCTEAGNNAYYTCGNCGKVYKDAEGETETTVAAETIAAKGHSMIETEAKEATCTEAGNNAYWYCENCEKYYSDAEGKTATTVADETIAAKGHSMTKTEAKEATCTEDGNNAYWTCENCHKVYKDAEGETETTVAAETIAAIGHDWGEVSYTWNADHRLCTATRVCGNDREHVDSETVLSSNEVTVKANCDHAGERTYTATFTQEGFESQQFVESIAIQAHVWGAASYTWSEDHKTCTATRICRNDANHTETETVQKVSSEITVEATCGRTGERTYTVEFENAAFATQIATEVIERLPHAWGEVSYTWNADHRLCTATRVCGNDREHVDSETVLSSNEVTVKANCDHAGERTYTATFTQESFESQQFVEPIAIQAHVWGAASYTWSEDHKTCTATRICGNDANHTETETVDSRDEVTVEATCEEAGERTYTAEFENAAFVAQTATERIEATGHELTEVEAVDPTCAEDGNSAYWYCENCEKFFVEDEDGTKEIEKDSWVIAATGEHSYESEDTTPAQPGVPGVRTYTCAVCGHSYTEEIPALPNITPGGPTGPIGPIGGPTGGNGDGDDLTDIEDEDPPLADVPMFFEDVTENNWFYTAVEFVFGKGMMKGYSETHFAPLDNISRGMIVSILYRLEDTPAAEDAGFTDIANGVWYADAVNWAAANKIVQGFGDGTFAPEQEISRCHLALILYNYAASKGYDMSLTDDLSDFSDVAEIPAYALNAMKWAVGAGVMRGSNGALNPMGKATRGEAAQMMKNFCETVIQ